MKICLDPGHGGSDPGAVGGNQREKDFTLSMAKKLKEYLEEKGVEVCLTREKDEYVSLSKRCSIANEKGVDLFVSIHVNSATSPLANGVETLCFSANSKGGSWAAKVQNALVEISGWRDRGVKERRDLAVLRGTDMPSILMEVGFISNEQERDELAKENLREKLMMGVAKALTGNVETPKEKEKMYHTLDEVPEWGKKTIEFLISKKALKGDGNDLNLSEEILRVFVVLDRLNVFGE